MKNKISIKRYIKNNYCAPLRTRIERRLFWTHSISS